MSRSVSSIIIVCSTLLLLADGRAYGPEGNKTIGTKKSGKKSDTKDPNEVTYYVLTQSWPPTGCIALSQDKLPNNSSCSVCKLPPLNSWTCHGLWPNTPNGRVSYCDHQEYNPDLINPEVKKLMNEKWRTWRVNGSNEEFWAHEYNKHGRCALNHPRMNTMTNYFSQTLELIDEYNVEKMLVRANITPGHTYDYSDIDTGLRNYLGAKFRLNCYRKKKSKEQYLHEVNICLDTSLKVINCPYKSTGSCARGVKVIYPARRDHCNSPNSTTSSS